MFPLPVRHTLRAPRTYLPALLLGAGILLPSPVRAQGPIERAVGGFLSNGAYFFTASSGREAFGSVQFYNETEIYARPLRIGDRLELSGGIQIVTVNDRFFPFTGGNQFALFGPALRITRPRAIGQLRPYFSAGLFVGNIRSDRIQRNVTDFTPGLSVGVEWPLTRFLTLSAGYRFIERIGGVDPSGFTLSLRIF